MSQQDRGAGGVLGDRSQDGGERLGRGSGHASVVCPPCPARLARLAAIGTLAGAFSALFGVGGGTIIVPLLILWLGYEEREATGTSLGAIVADRAARRGRRTAPSATSTSPRAS